MKKKLRKMKVLGGVAGRRRESLQGGETARPGSNIVEHVRFGRPGPLPGPSRPMPPPGPSFWTLLAWSWVPKMRAGNLLAQPTGPNCTRPRRRRALEAPERRRRRRRSFVRKRVQQKSTNTAEARDSEQKLPTCSTRIQIQKKSTNTEEDYTYKILKMCKIG